MALDVDRVFVSTAWDDPGAAVAVIAVDLGFTVGGAALPLVEDVLRTETVVDDICWGLREVGAEFTGQGANGDAEDTEGGAG